ncbi:Pro-kumamolisin, activation domain-containing protein [Cytidiella melzeri]|nr:Pro-kumamolisin, activation domain-containing protein [Cytidiella melzeri]
MAARHGLRLIAFLIHDYPRDGAPDQHAPMVQGSMCYLNLYYHPLVCSPAMLSLKAVVALFALFTSSMGFYPLVRHEARRALPPLWEHAHRAPADATLPLRIGLAQSNIDRIEEYLLDVSHPESSNYGNHWSAAEVADKFRPSSETVDVVREWLVKKGIDPSKIQLSKNGGWIEAKVSVAEAEDLLKTEYHVYNHATTGGKHVGCASGFQNMCPDMSRSSLRRSTLMQSSTGDPEDPTRGSASCPVLLRLWERLDYLFLVIGSLV